MFGRDPYNKLLKVVVGNRPEWAPKDDHYRYGPPGRAVELGADFLVVGRPLLFPPKEVGSTEAALNLWVEEVATALHSLTQAA